MATPSLQPSRFVELLAPAGDWECVSAAVENGADAIYFGLDCGFNARYRAQNFGVHDLEDIARSLHRRAVRGYVTLNTLVFPDELANLARVIERVAESGIDAVLVQDFGVARLVKAICPDLEVHASTQMSLTSAETIRVAGELELSRVVLARELSVAEIAAIASASAIPLEVFIHGALCVAYSGQCLTSESLGGRSANRGQCAQACRLPYQLICDGVDRDLGDVKYLLSPQDLAGYEAIPELIKAGVASLKIEGRLKSPEYVANITKHYRKAIDEAIANEPVSISDADRQEMELSFSRGFSPGWLRGNDHKQLVPGLDSAKRGIRLGNVCDVKGPMLCVRLDASVALGDGLAIRGRDGKQDQGGRIYSLRDEAGTSQKQIGAGSLAWIGFGPGEWNGSHQDIGAAVFKNDDPQLNRRLRKSFSGRDPVQRQPVDFDLVARVGEPLRLRASLTLPGAFSGTDSEQRWRVRSAEVTGSEALSAATRRPADFEMLREKLSRLGGTPFYLRDLTVKLEGEPMVPVGMLNHLRRDLIAALISELEKKPERTIQSAAGQALLQPIRAKDPSGADPEDDAPRLAVLCRSLAQVGAAAQSGADLIYADFHDIRQYGEAVSIARGLGCPIGIASVRIQKPSEMGLLRVLLRHDPDWILARNLAAVAFARENSLPFIADFSLNVANHRSAEWIRQLGAIRVTASYDLNREQILGLIDSLPAAWLEVVLHQHMPMFHMEHCVFCSVLSPGTNKTNCGRPCDRHEVKLRDRVGAEHPLQADVACRNTLYNATPQSGAEIASELLRRNVTWFRLEMLEEDVAETSRTISLYRKLLDGVVPASDVWRQLRAANRLGVTRGTLESKRNPLAIL